GDGILVRLGAELVEVKQQPEAAGLDVRVHLRGEVGLKGEDGVGQDDLPERVVDAVDAVGVDRGGEASVRLTEVGRRRRALLAVEVKAILGPRFVVYGAI